MFPFLVKRSGKYEDALEKFESVLGSKPEPNESAVASYNVACCYSKLDKVIAMNPVPILLSWTGLTLLSNLLQIQAGLSALDDAMDAGFEDYKVG